MPAPLPPSLPNSPFNPFYILTGVTFLSFASGFGVCLFNLDTVNECVDVANSWVGVFKAMGDHLIAWALAIGYAAFHR